VNELDVIASEGQFVAHIMPVWAALPAEARGLMVADPGPLAGREDVPVLIASHGDLRRARAAGKRRIARIEHGHGQSYGGDPASAGHSSYPGGRDHDDVSLFLVPGEHPAGRWRATYPAARVEVVGCPRLDLPVRHETEPEPIVALSFHYHAMVGCPEGDGTWRWYRGQLRRLAGRFRLLGHAHPRWAARIRPWFLNAGAEFTYDFDEVRARAAVYACDNSSTIFEFAASGERPVVLLNAPHYRRRIEHGLRFWSEADVGLHADPTTVGSVLERALGETVDPAVRSEVLDRVYAHRGDATERAVAAILDWAG
jgi:hypothetical protein